MNTSTHCARCRLTFYGEDAFVRHQVHVRDDGRLVCVDPMSDARKGDGLWWLDGREVWHYGPRMTGTARAALHRRSGKG